MLQINDEIYLKSLTHLVNEYETYELAIPIKVKVISIGDTMGWAATVEILENIKEQIPTHGHTFLHKQNRILVKETDISYSPLDIMRHHAYRYNK